jgi:Excalibur calcium-binding domain
MKLHVLAVSAVIAAAVACGGTSSAALAIPARWKNCTQVNKRYPHGVGRLGAHDKTSGTPVTTFKRSTYLYRTAMRYNRGLDRDKDGIACEKL